MERHTSACLVYRLISPKDDPDLQTISMQTRAAPSSSSNDLRWSLTGTRRVSSCDRARKRALDFITRIKISTRKLNKYAKLGLRPAAVLGNVAGTRLQHTRKRDTHFPHCAKVTSVHRIGESIARLRHRASVSFGHCRHRDSLRRLKGENRATPCCVLRIEYYVPSFGALPTAWQGSDNTGTRGGCTPGDSLAPSRS